MVPSVREACVREMLNAWDLVGEFWDSVIVIEDGPAKTFSLPQASHHCSWKEIDEQLKEKAWVISRRDSAIRCFGFLKAYELGAEYIFTLDDDCLPIGPLAAENLPTYEHVRNLTKTSRWASSVPGSRTRGLPYRNLGVATKTVLSVGLWEGKPDFDAIQTLSGADERLTLPETRVLPLGQYVPICGMNLAFKREITPLMYFPLQGEGRPYSRFDDIWMGVICKKICDHLGLMITVGRPYVHHKKASDPFANLVKEAPGVAFNETFWEDIDGVRLTGDTPLSCMTELGYELAAMNDPYMRDLGGAMQTWASLFG